MWIVILVAGIGSVAGGIVLLRNYEDAYSLLRGGREEILGQWAVSKRPQPEILRKVAVGWMVIGVLFVVVAVLSISGLVKFPLS